MNTPTRTYITWCACFLGSRGLSGLSTYGLSDEMYARGDFNSHGIHSFLSWLQLRGISVRAVRLTGENVRGYDSVLRRLSHLTLRWSHAARPVVVHCNRRTLRSLHVITDTSM